MLAAMITATGQLCSSLAMSRFRVARCRQPSVFSLRDLPFFCGYIQSRTSRSRCQPMLLLCSLPGRGSSSGTQMKTAYLLARAAATGAACEAVATMSCGPLIRSARKMRHGFEPLPFHCDCGRLSAAFSSSCGGVRAQHCRHAVQQRVARGAGIVGRAAPFSICSLANHTLSEGGYRSMRVTGRFLREFDRQESLHDLTGSEIICRPLKPSSGISVQLDKRMDAWVRGVEAAMATDRRALCASAALQRAESPPVNLAGLDSAQTVRRRAA